MKLRMVEDGLSKMLWVGEKHVQVSNIGQLAGFDCSTYNPDVLPKFARFAGTKFPLAANQTEAVNSNFGSWHPGICQFVFGDGSVHPLQVTIDSVILGYLADRRDGNIVEEGI
jgi:hypothetical protein